MFLVSRTPLAFVLLALAANGVIAAEPPVAPKTEEARELPRAKLDEGVFVQSGDIRIPGKDVEKVMTLFLTAERKKNPRNVPAADTLLRSRVEIAEVLLQNAVVEKYAKEHSLNLSKEELDKHIEGLRSILKNRNTTFEQMLVDSGQSEEEYRRFWSAKLGIEKEAAKIVTDAEIQKLFDENYAKVPLRSAAHILVQYKGADSAAPELTRTKEEARALAEDLLKQLKAGKEFADLAKTSDDESSRAKGGAVDFFPLKGKDSMVPAFGEAVYKLQKIGDIAPVIETPYGFHVIKLTGIRDDDLKRQIRYELSQQKFNERVHPILKDAVDHEQFSDKLTALSAQLPPPGTGDAEKK